MRRKAIRLLVADERPGMELAAALAALPGVRVCAEVATASEVMEAVESLQPQCLLVDVSLPRLGGLDLLRALRRLHRELPVVAVCLEGGRPRAAATLRAGARAFLLREGASRAFPAALAAVLAGKPYVDERIASRRRPRREAVA
ncbi:MAG: response regulator transcription factor [Elusimicrobia bacterium]|nr:response regulator transcription factor [Elusimicrobiota bacterium]